MPVPKCRNSALVGGLVGGLADVGSEGGTFGFFVKRFL
jgi:hypothetical protein